MAAAVRSPHVKVVIPDGALSHAFRSFPATYNGVVGWSLLWWLHLVETGEDLYSDIDALTAVTNHRPALSIDEAVFGRVHEYWRQTALQMEQDGPFWQRWSLDGKLDSFCTPILLLQAASEWEDDMLDIFLDLRGNSCDAVRKGAQRFVLGAHAHTGAVYDPFADDAVGVLIRSYLDKYLKNAEIDLSTTPAVHFFIQNGGEWHTAAAWPVAANTLELYLDADANDSNNGALVDATPVGNLSTAYAFDPEVDDACSATQSPAAVFTSELLAENADIAGAVEAHLFVTADVADTDLFAYLYDVSSDFQRWSFVSTSALRLRFRNSWTAPAPVVPGEVMAVDLKMSAVGYRVPAGRRLALVVTSSECDRSENPNTGGPMMTETETRPATVHILTGPDHPSRLAIPTGP
jgi:hypothetical protein